MARVQKMVRGARGVAVHAWRQLKTVLMYDWEEVGYMSRMLRCSTCAAAAKAEGPTYAPDLERAWHSSSACSAACGTVGHPP